MVHTPYKLVALDLDGTVLSADYTIDPGLKSAIKDAVRKGISFTIATGRMFASAMRFAEELACEIPLITYNGSVIREALSGRELWHLRVPLDAALNALQVMEGKALRYAFLDDHVATDTPHEWTDRYASVLGIEIRSIESLSAHLKTDPTMLVFMCEEHETRAFTDLLEGELDSKVRLTNSNPWFVDVLNARASKATALAHLADYAGIPLSQTIAIGDSWNDIEMIETAGLGIAVANASDALKNKADYVTKAERGLGVLEALEKFVL